MNDVEAKFSRVAGIGAIGGIVLLFAANIALGSPPDANDPAKVAGFLADSRNQVLTSVILFDLAYGLLLIFSAGIRQRLRRAGDASGLPDLAYGAAIWVNVLGMVGQTAVAAAAFRAPGIDPRTAQSLVDILAVSYALIGVPFAVLFASVSVSARATRAFPAWVNWVGLLAAALNLAKLATLFPRSGGLAPGGALSIVPVVPIWIWTIAVGVLMIRRHADLPSPRATS